MIKVKQERYWAKGVVFGLGVIAICGFLFSKPCFANEELAAKSRPAVREDILGEWQMFYQVVDPKVRTDSLFFAKHQFWLFSEDGYVRNIASTQLLEPSELAVLFRTMPLTGTFSFGKAGVFTIERTSSDQDLIVVSIIVEDMQTQLRPNAPLLKKGDLVLSYLGPQNQPYMQRFLRR